jgi:hypothetical protein
LGRMDKHRTKLASRESKRILADKDSRHTPIPTEPLP